MNKYYKAYDKRYKQIHDLGLSWSVDSNTIIVEEIIKEYNLDKKRILELGCGEGRDARYLLNKNINVLATDVSQEAINYCINKDKKHMNNYQVLDILNNNFKEKFDFIYSVACLHMFVLDDDRSSFFKFVYHHLNDNGLALILSMGDGISESSSEISKSFNTVKRIHQESNMEVNIAATSCRIVNFETLLNEIQKSGFDTIKYGVTSIDNHFDKIMYVLIKKS